MSGFPLDLTISALEIFPSFSIRTLTVQTKDLAWSKIDVGWSHWL
jgi:hypothetical protein